VKGAETLAVAPAFVPAAQNWGRVVRAHPSVALLPLLVTCLVMGVGVFVITWVANSERHSARERATIIAQAAASWLQGRINEVAAAVRITSNIIAFDPQWPFVAPVFASVAPSIRSEVASIRTLQLQPSGVIRASDPTLGNENALGLNVFECESTETPPARRLDGPGTWPTLRLQ
jgi:sensor domain CHASE-containing protein